MNFATDKRLDGSRDSAVARWRDWIFPTLLVAATALAYSNSFRVPLLFDDEVSIRDNPSLRNLADIRSVLFAPTNVFTGGRPLLNLSFALNYQWSGTSVEGYHVVNLLIHILAGLVLFGLVRRTLQRPGLAERWSGASARCAAVAAALWLLHPLATESVTYLSQRAESLMGLFYLLALYSAVRSVEARYWEILAVVAGWAAVGVKEVAATAPVVVLLYDRTFLSGSIRAALRKRPVMYAGLAAAWVFLAALMVCTHVTARGVGFEYGVPWWKYALVETRAIATYLKLALCPAPLIFDYGEVPFHTSWGSLAPSVAAVIVAAAVVIMVWRRSQRMAFLLIAFFILLAPTSSFVPIALQPVAESRMYLPLATITTGVAMAGFAWGRQYALGGLALLALVLGALTVGRNRDYRSAITIWEDTVTKAPSSARACNNLGLALLADPHRRAEAKQQFEAALALKRAFPEAEFNLANALRDEGDTAAAVRHYEAALQLKPKYGAAHNNLGMLLARARGDHSAAIGHFEAAIGSDPRNVEAHYNLANLLAENPATFVAAVREYRIVIDARPAAAEPHNNLAIVLARSGDLNGAVAELETALRLQPDYSDARRNLDLVRQVRGH